MLMVLLLAVRGAVFAWDHFQTFKDSDINAWDMFKAYWLIGVVLACLAAVGGLFLLKPWGRGLAILLSLITFLQGVTGLFGNSVSRAHALPAIVAGCVILYLLNADGTTKDSFRPESLF